MYVGGGGVCVLGVCVCAAFVSNSLAFVKVQYTVLGKRYHESPGLYCWTYCRIKVQSCPNLLSTEH